eukprot:m.1080446 g.1080446  ORF g.1080446 m.1080446 type:complete len:121 (-) comp24256_c0_seq2:2453-2815(-)
MLGSDSGSPLSTALYFPKQNHPVPVVDNKTTAIPFIYCHGANYNLGNTTTLPFYSTAAVGNTLRRILLAPVPRHGVGPRTSAEHAARPAWRPWHARPCTRHAQKSPPPGCHCSARSSVRW